MTRIDETPFVFVGISQVLRELQPIVVKRNKLFCLLGGDVSHRLEFIATTCISDGTNQLFLVEGYTDPVRTSSEDTPMVIFLLSFREAKCVNSLCTDFLSISFHEVRVVPIIPSLRIKQSNSVVLQHMRKR